MSTASSIRRFVNALAEGQTFTTRDVVNLGPRSAVDRALAKLITKDRIVRLAHGVYMRGDETTPLPSLAQIASAKAASYGKELLVQKEDLLEKLRLTAACSDKSVITYWVNGSSSEFKYGDKKIIFKSVSAKRVQLLKKGGPALSLAALAHVGKKKVTRTEIMMTATFNNHERQQLKELLHAVPDWLSKFYLR